MNVLEGRKMGKLIINGFPNDLEFTLGGHMTIALEKGEKINIEIKADGTYCVIR